MNDSQRRRRELLLQTRELYSEKRNLPAVHPRFGAAYGQLYGTSDDDGRLSDGGTLGIRIFICVMLFAGFVTMDMKDTEVLQMDSQRIVNEIQTDMDVKEVWQNL